LYEAEENGIRDEALEEAGHDVSAQPVKHKGPTWNNADGLPTVSQTRSSSAYDTPDMADGGNSSFRPNLGCKCNDMRPAPSHPVIQLRKDFLVAYPEFLNKLDRLKVHMEDITNKPPVVVWDAQYDMKRFGDQGNQGMLKETHPAIPGEGKQVRFMTFCPTGGPHSYSLKVTGLDQDGNELQDLIDSESTFQATPPDAGNLSVEA